MSPNVDNGQPLLTMRVRADRLWTNARMATLAGPDLGLVDDGVVACANGRIVYAGPAADAPPLDAAETFDCNRRWITPGLIDCHTHLVFGGNRAGEFEQRLTGASYETIAATGGGILATVRATRAACDETLLSTAIARLECLIAEGVTTVEVKSGYGLDLPTEVRMLQVARRLGAERPVRIVSTFLGAHALPNEAAGDRDAYIAQVCQEMLPAVAALGLADIVDGFCEQIAFSPGQIARVFEAAAGLGLPVRLHADQRSNSGGARLAAHFRALSADHLEYTDESGAAALAVAGTVAVLLPGAFYTLRETCLPPVSALRRHGTPMAIATDCNPGTSPLTSILLAMNMAATLFGLTVAECIAGVTREAARALGRLSEIGTLEPGKACDLAIWSVDRLAELVYLIGFNPLYTRVFNGHASFNVPGRG